MPHYGKTQKHANLQKKHQSSLLRAKYPTEW
jgi:hypothetical protein